MGLPSNVFCSTSGYFVNGNTELISDMTDNWFYASAELILLCIRLNFTSLSGPAIVLQKMLILAKKIIFSVEAHFDLGKIVAFKAQKTLLDYYLFCAAKDKCYPDKPETIDALKDNIGEASDKIQLHTIDNVLKNWNWLRQPLEGL